MSSAADNVPEKQLSDEREETGGDTNMGGEDPSSSADDDEVSAVTEEPPVSQREKGTKKWLVIVVALMVFGFIAYVAKGFWQSPQDETPRSATAEIPATPTKIIEPLVDFLLPLKETGKKILLQISMEVHWPQEARARFMQKQVGIRDKIYARLREMAGARLITVERGRLRSGQRAKLTDEITRILERELATPDIGVYIKEAKLL